jgi:hypothetical protein
MAARRLIEAGARRSVAGPRVSRLSRVSAGAHVDPGTVAIGTWSGGRFMRFGEPLDDDRSIATIVEPERDLAPRVAV